MINLCSLWDIRYHTKGLALIRSLRYHLSDWHLWVLALDDQTEDYLNAKPDDHITVIALSEIMDDRLSAIRSERTWQEFCWTLASYWTHAVMTCESLNSLSYVDSDMFLFGNLAPLYMEVGKANVAIVPHRWTPEYIPRLKPNGTYNVGWVYFSRQGMDCLNEWKEQCLDWCFYRIENGKMADQGYLEDWPTRWNAHVVQHLGVGLAPWNQEQYCYEWDEGKLYVIDGDPCLDFGVRNIKRIDPVLLYHFHSHQSNRMRGGYPIHPMVASYLYRPYEHEIDHLPVKL